MKWINPEELENLTKNADHEQQTSLNGILYSTQSGCYSAFTF